MTADQSIQLSEKVSNQVSGLVLIFSAYRDDEAKDYEWIHAFVPKQFVSMHNGCGSSFFMHSVGFGYIAAKYLYIFEEKINGNSSNALNQSSNGITYNNADFALRYVIGV